MIGQIGGFVHAAVRGEGVQISVRCEFLLVKTLRNSYDRATHIANRSNPHQYVNWMSVFVPQLHPGLMGLAIVQGSGEGTGSAASHTPLVVTVHQNIVAAGVPYDVVPLVPGKPFGALIPEQNFPQPIRDINTRLQTV